jgi:DeoR family suf operon transcriptional repressor
MSALSNIGQRQQLLLKALLHSPKGLTVDQLAQELSISRNAVHQHLASLEGQRYIENSLQSSTGGRPGRIYKLSAIGQELFPRHYSLFSRLLLQLVQQKLGDATLKECMSSLGEQLASEYKTRVQNKGSTADQIREVKLIMSELGYETQLDADEANPLEIVASNCVFHQLAADCKEVCELDLSLMASLLDASIEHKECMVRGGECCRFGVSIK